MHTYMQFCSYPAAARDADAELERLMADRFLTEEPGRCHRNRPHPHLL